ncbi:helix-turn-helix transcriptional regulator [Bacillus safensis]|uniref:helix-turn-helix domain-containing protein n=1 Tax=Bacillus TaxID=1386 RepID=UPI001643484A|nr:MULTISPECIES: helix-turn-helix transcriptional regulator [Bacillus]MCY7542471.1 helix-turn-helix transcriptional regulator [Bacillus safensis]MCY7552590.1 helix-turn-helix transcriptional regulator [Bacillus safensis]MCY7644777.1 helix-turn-helix transcriptional regulator [Bacillus safensis]MCY7655908.1 helix-turn-helix transcriptional regulator [Bacillus safensis]MEC3710383.1 helix-turn-helix transcriptional regulator [Bacillus safensis]
MPNNLINIIEQSNKTIESVATESGISVKRLKEIISNPEEARLIEMAKIAIVLNSTIEELM